MNENNNAIKLPVLSISNPHIPSMSDPPISIPSISNPPISNINILQEPTIPSTVFYLGFLFTAGVVVGSMLGMIVTTKERKS